MIVKLHNKHCKFTIIGELEHYCLFNQLRRPKLENPVVHINCNAKIVVIFKKVFEMVNSVSYFLRV